MKQPIRVTVDAEWPLAYIEYRDQDESTGWYGILREPDGSVQEYGSGDGRNDEPVRVMAEVNDDDEIVAIEIITIDDPELVAIARQYAADNDLAFPDDLRAAAARSPAA
ncbi:MAG TPA: hypothetical protein VGD01_10160 [Candidatus Elarobacter sp.]|jgi:hypothetical protein